ncbi:methionyl-tRNA formyltransferase [Fundidesulfovibrio terrae]|uniref:methionyl-tRNA formyltransferase n=1 Tax=Fundidesulfovibrio terrae TaxID=2922866 RepID=UPI001FAF6C27|nr:methionyl-tRNA formyltransferase [Fundidesulfovibrio terrae]
MGTPDFAAATLKKVIQSGAGEVVGVYSQPDRPCGRGHKCVPSPVKRLALEHGVPVFQPLNFKTPEAVAELASLTPDVLLVAAYGLILPQSVLDIPKLGPWNVHASLLPKYRGAAPIQRAILAGETETGITIMRMEAGLDTGPMLIRREVSIGPDEDAGSLHDRLAALGGEMAVEALGMLATGPVAPVPQDGAKATYAAKLTKDDTHIFWDRPVQEVHNRIRAMSPRPGAFFTLAIPGENRQIRLQALPGRYSQGVAADAPPGCVLGLSEGMLRISCADGVYMLPSIKPSGKQFMDATAFSCGYLSKVDPGLPLVCPPPADLL